MNNDQELTFEIKQHFLSSAIADISAYIQFSDTKVSIIMGSAVALIAGAMACHESICSAVCALQSCSWRGLAFTLCAIAECISLAALFVCGLLTIRAHQPHYNYNSKWFLVHSVKEYDFDSYRKDIIDMSANDVIENMAAELYKLNDIYRQKAVTVKWTVRSFALSLSLAALMLFILL